MVKLLPIRFFVFIVFLLGCTSPENKESFREPPKKGQLISINNRGVKTSLRIPGDFSVADTNSVESRVGRDYEGVVEINVLARIKTANDYDFNIEVYSEPQDAQDRYSKRLEWSEEGGQTGLEIVKQGKNYIIYKGSESNTVFYSIIIVKQLGKRWFVTDTEQVHFETDKIIPISYEDCLKIADIYESIN